MGRDVPAGGVRVTPLVFDEALRAQAASEPDAPALVDASTRMTYAELDEHVGVTAAALGEAGLRPGERAVLVADNSAHHLVTAFAICGSARPAATSSRPWSRFPRRDYRSSTTSRLTRLREPPGIPAALDPSVRHR